MKKIIVYGSFLCCLNACKTDSSPVKAKDEKLSSPTPVHTQDDPAVVARDSTGTIQSAKGKAQPDTAHANKTKTRGWPDIAKTFFFNQCMKDGNFMPKDQAKDYCNCMLTKIQEKFPNLEEAGKMTQEEAHAFSASCLK